MIDTLYGHVKNVECVFVQSYASPTDLRSMTQSRHRYTRMVHLIIVELLCALMPNHSNDLAMVCVVDDDAGCSRKYFRSLSFAFVCRFADKFVDLFDGNGNAISRRLHLNNHRRHPKKNIEICYVNVQRRVVCVRASSIPPFGSLDNDTDETAI